MSLTSHLNNIKSPIHDFIYKKYFHETKSITTKIREQVDETFTIKPDRDASKGRYDYSLIGMAFDYRFRYFFSNTPHVEFMATRGASRISDDAIAFKNIDENSGISLPYSGRDKPSLSADLLNSFFAYLENNIEKFKPYGRKLDLDEERVLNRCCLLLGDFESIARNPKFEFLTSKFAPFQHSTDFNDLLNLYREEYINDLCSLSSCAYDLFQTRFSSNNIVLNPKFEGSRDVGGADADLIIDHSLIEIKTTLDPKKNPGLFVRQLLGYVLLDYNDQYQIKEIEIFFPRQKSTVHFPIEEVIHDMTGENIDIIALRNEFMLIVKK